MTQLERAASAAHEVDPPRAVVTRRANAERLRELVTNLLSNAIQYNREGGRIDVDVWEESRFVNIRVADTGVGIGPEHLPRIFDRFYRADQARVRRDGGAGLALAIAKSIAEAHSGSMTCVSTPGHGTAFVVRLPTGKPVAGAERQPAGKGNGTRPATSDIGRVNSSSHGRA